MLESLIIIYDAQCSLCCGCMEWIKLHAIRKGIFEFIPCQSDKRKVRFPGLSEVACLESLHVILPGGKMLFGEKTLPEIVCRLRYYRWLSIFFRIPVIRLFLFALYRCVANSRSVISRTIEPLIEEKR